MRKSLFVAVALAFAGATLAVPLHAAPVSVPGLSSDELVTPIAAKKKVKVKKCKKGKVYSKKKRKCVAKKRTRKAAKMVAPSK